MIITKTLTTNFDGAITPTLENILKIKTAPINIKSFRKWEHMVDPNEETETIYLQLQHSQNPDGEEIRIEEFFDSKLNILFLVIVRAESKNGGYLEVLCTTTLNHKIKYKSFQMFEKVLLWQSDSKISGWHTLPL